MLPIYFIISDEFNRLPKIKNLFDALDLVISYTSENYAVPAVDLQTVFHV